MLKIYLGLLISILSTTYSFGQEYFNIANEGVHTIDCSTDSIIVNGNGDEYGFYSITFCLGEGAEGNLEVVISPALYGDLWNVTGYSAISVYDGPSTASQLIGGGSYNSLDTPNGILIRSTNSCITLAYSSQTSSAGQGFTAHVQCETSYQPFLVDFTADPEFQVTSIDSMSIGLCLSDTFTINANVNYIPIDSTGNGFEGADSTTYFNWQMGDGMTKAGYGLTEISYAYTSGAGHTVNLSITNKSGTTQSHQFSVLQSVRPNFSNIPLNDTICVGSETQISGGLNHLLQDTVGVNPGFGAILSGASFSGLSYVFDANPPECDSQSQFLQITGFEQGQTLNNISDIFNICVNMHHSYLGDLEMGLICPGGQDTLVLFDMRDEYGTCPSLFNVGSNTGGRDLGEPDANPEPIGYDYCFNNNPVFGTFETVNADLPSELPMPAGSYEPMTSIENLIGCSLNGEWELIFLDGWLGNVGYINSWSIFFNPDIIPSTEYYSPGIVTAGWDENPDLTINEDSTSVTVTPSNAGDNEYVFWAYDEFGCRHDTVINIYARSEINLDDSQDCGLSQILSPYGGLDEQINDAVYTILNAPTGTADISVEQIEPGIYEATATDYGLYNVMIASADCGYSAQANLIFLEEDNPACITGINEIEFNKEIVIAPNPASNYAELKFTIKKAQEVQIKVNTLDGKVISKQKHHFSAGDQNQRINLEKFESGAYLVTVLGETFKDSGLLIKQ